MKDGRYGRNQAVCGFGPGCFRPFSVIRSSPENIREFQVPHRQAKASNWRENSGTQSHACAIAGPLENCGAASPGRCRIQMHRFHEGTTGFLIGYAKTSACRPVLNGLRRRSNPADSLTNSNPTCRKHGSSAAVCDTAEYATQNDRQVVDAARFETPFAPAGQEPGFCHAPGNSPAWTG